MNCRITSLLNVLPFTDKLHWLWYQSCSLLWTSFDTQWNEQPLGNVRRQFEAFHLKSHFYPFVRDERSWYLLSYQVYWLGPMCGGIAAALIYDFLLYPRTQNFRTRWYVLLRGPEDENYAHEIIEEDSSNPASTQWPKHWITWIILALSTYINHKCFTKMLSNACWLSFFDFLWLSS